MDETPNWPKAGSWEESVLIGMGAAEGEEIYLGALYAAVKVVRSKFKLPMSATWEATVRRTLQESDLFEQKAPRSGFWKLSEYGKKVQAAANRPSKR